MRKHPFSLGLALAAAAVSNAGSQVYAADVTELAEVVVTAEKRVEPEQKTPISMDVFSSEEIAQKGIVDLQSLSVGDPSVNFANSGAESYLTIRGVSSHDLSETGDPAVPVVIDGFTTIRPYALTTSLYDLQRIEVLRGPQGTLYGRNASGGLINVISQKPGREFGIGASAELGNFNTNNFSGYVNIPLADSLRVRISGASRRHDGYRILLPTDGLPAGRADDEDSRSARVQADWSPLESFDAWVLFQSTQIGGVGLASEGIGADFTATGDIPHTKPPYGDTRHFAQYGILSQNIDDKVTKWQLAYSALPAGLSLTYLGGYDNLQWHHATPSPTALGNPLTVPVTFFQNEFPKTVNHELRLASNASGPFVWQTGLYYFEERNTNLNSYLQANADTATANTLVQFSYPLVDTKSKAVFGQGSFNINDENKLTVGARYSKDTKSRDGVEYLYFLFPTPLPNAGNSESSKTTYHIGYDWSPTAENLVYAKYDTGYKPGGFNQCNSYAAEEVKAAELGSKNRFLGNTLQVNVDGFYDKYQNQQVSTFSPNCPQSGQVVENAGESKIYGFEATLQALLGDSDKVDLGLTLLHARFESFLAAPALTAATADCRNAVTSDAGINCQLAGNMLPQAPNVTVSAGYEHSFRLPEAALLKFRIEGRYQTKQYFDPFNFGDTEQNGYGLINAYLNYSRDKWQIGIFGRNLADKLYLVNAEEYTPPGAHAYRYGFGAPRTFGVHVEATL